MDAIKIQNFEREHGISTFPQFRHLSRREATAVGAEIAKSLSLSSEIEIAQLSGIIAERATPLEGCNADTSTFNFIEILQRVAREMPSRIYLNWRHFDDIDEMELRHFTQYFDDLWYPSVDDLEIIASDYSWIISIHHSGTVALLRLNKR